MLSLLLWNPFTVTIMSERKRRPHTKNRRPETINVSGLWAANAAADSVPDSPMQSIGVRYPKEDLVDLQVHCQKLSIASGRTPGEERSLILRRLLRDFLAGLK